MKHLRNLFGAMMLLVTALTLTGCGNGDNALEEIINGAGGGGSEATVTFTASDGVTPIMLTSLTLKNAGLKNGYITISSETPVSSVTMNVQNSLSGKQTYEVEAIDDKGLPWKASIDLTLTQGNTYNEDISLAFDALNCPLTFEAISSTMQLYLQNHTSTDKVFFYRIDNGLWTPLIVAQNTEQILGPATIIQLKGNNNAYAEFDGSTSKSSRIVSDDAFYMYGNINSLLTTENFASITEYTVANRWAFFNLFNNNNKMKSHDTKELVLPCTKMAERCYSWMFKACSGLTRAPVLPAMELAEGCYFQMFYSCYGLTKAPDLPAKKLEKNCYYEMFRNCNQLNYVKCLATDRTAFQCIFEWLSGVPATGGTFVGAPGMTWTPGTCGIPTGWTSIEATD